ncbi:MAG: DUF1152 domain-containing protein [Planctomycetaceae bacterium]|nr:DUF1152 domain-containing protein [Planctomycetaceae bacterium]
MSSLHGFELPFFAELENSQRILIAGAGGGFDVFTGLPLYFLLKASGRDAYLANLSFSSLPDSVGRRLAPGLLEVTADSQGYAYYFPEQVLASWFRQQGEEVSIYSFHRMGVKPLLAGYRELVRELNLDTVILVDGGTDSLMRGDEAGLGTPFEDMASVAAVRIGRRGKRSRSEFGSQERKPRHSRAGGNPEQTPRAIHCLDFRLRGNDVAILARCLVRAYL